MLVLLSTALVIHLKRPRLVEDTTDLVLLLVVHIHILHEPQHHVSAHDAPNTNVVVLVQHAQEFVQVGAWKNAALGFSLLPL